MKYRKITTLCACLVAMLAGSATDANAAIFVKIKGVGGDSLSTWTFSGSDTVTAPGTTGSSRVEWSGSSFDPFGPALDGQSLSANSGTVTLTGSALSEDLTTNTLWIDHDGGSKDNFGLLGAGVLNVPYTAGTISWSGVLVMPVAFDDLNPGAYTGAVPSLLIAAAFIGTSVDITITAVPEPATMSLLGLGGIGLLSLGRRQRKVSGV